MINGVPVKSSFFFGLVALLCLTACQAADTPVSVLATTSAESKEGVADFPLTPSAEAAPTQTAAEPQAQVRTEFIATDPDTVELASGQVQLIEFFAFW